MIYTGKIDLEELIRAFKDLGVEMERAEARKLLRRYVYIYIVIINNKYNFFSFLSPIFHLKQSNSDSELNLNVPFLLALVLKLQFTAFELN